MAETFLPIFPDAGGVPERVSFAPSQVPVSFGEGFYEEELEGNEPFRWMSPSGRMAFEPEPEERFLELWVRCEFGDLSQELRARSGEHEETLALVDGWGRLSLRVPPNTHEVLFSVNRPFPRDHYPSDPRTLTVRLREPRLHSDPDRHSSVRRQWSNAVLNTRELLAGKTVLESTPTSLGIDLHGACNVKPPCVYCEWDVSKEQEGENVDAPFTLETLAEYGPFFENTSKLVNCSIGEPFMMRDFDELLGEFGEKGKTLEMATNGQILTERNIEKLLGRHIELYISLDAATPETYARLRNDTFEKILQNVRRLVKAKGGRGQWPRVLLVFMPMRANVHELDAFVELSAELGVDQMVLRPLNETSGNELVWERNGYRYEYEKELLPFDALVRVSGRARELAHRLRVDLHDQLDFGGNLEGAFEEEFTAGRRELAPVATSEPASTGATPFPEEPTSEPAPGSERTPLGFEKWPVCTEPWKHLYILRRGIRPCCYGGAPIADMDEYNDAWNSLLLQSIRKRLLEGTFHEYCLKSPACPIVRKSEHSHSLPLLQEGSLWMWRAWQKLNALSGGAPRWALRRVRSARARVLEVIAGPR